MLRQFFLNIPWMEDAARIDGANRFRIYWQVICPRQAGVITIGLFTFMSNWSSFTWPWWCSVTSRVPDNRGAILPGRAVHLLRPNLAASLIATLPLVLIFASQRTSSAASADGLKGTSLGPVRRGSATDPLLVL